MTKFDKAMVCVCVFVCVYTSGMDGHREGWTGEAIVSSFGHLMTKVDKAMVCGCVCTQVEWTGLGRGGLVRL